MHVYVIKRESFLNWTHASNFYNDLYQSTVIVMDVVGCSEYMVLDTN